MYCKFIFVNKLFCYKKRENFWLEIFWSKQAWSKRFLGPKSFFVKIKLGTIKTGKQWYNTSETMVKQSSNTGGTLVKHW